MKWKLNTQEQTVSLTNLEIVRGEDDTPIAYIGDRNHSELIRSAPQMEEALIEAWKIIDTLDMASSDDGASWDKAQKWLNDNSKYKRVFL